MKLDEILRVIKNPKKFTASRLCEDCVHCRLDDWGKMQFADCVRKSNLNYSTGKRTVNKVSCVISRRFGSCYPLGWFWKKREGSIYDEKS